MYRYMLPNIAMAGHLVYVDLFLLYIGNGNAKTKGLYS